MSNPFYCFFSDRWSLSLWCFCCLLLFFSLCSFWPCYITGKHIISHLTFIFYFFPQRLYFLTNLVTLKMKQDNPAGLIEKQRNLIKVINLALNIPHPPIMSRESLSSVFMESYNDFVLVTVIHRFLHFHFPTFSPRVSSLCLFVFRVYTLIHVVSYRSSEKNYKEKDEVSNYTQKHTNNQEAWLCSATTSHGPHTYRQ